MAPPRGPALPPIDPHAAASTTNRGARPRPRKPSEPAGSPPRPAETPARGLSPPAPPIAPTQRAPAPRAAQPSAACIRFRADTAGPGTAPPARRPGTPPPAPSPTWPTSPPAADLSAAPFATAARAPAPDRLPGAARGIRPAPPFPRAPDADRKAAP